MKVIVELPVALVDELRDLADRRGLSVTQPTQHSLELAMLLASKNELGVQLFLRESEYEVTQIVAPPILKA